jgi:signal transduction histidine kinase/CheY-like chemotaxis protein
MSVGGDDGDDEDVRLRLSALQNVQSILHARQRAEQELVKTKEALEEERRLLELLNRTGATLASTLNLQTVVASVTDTATELSGAEQGVFFYRATGGVEDGFALRAVSGPDGEAFAPLDAERATALLGPTLGGEAVIRLDDVRTDPRFENLAPPGAPPLDPPVQSYLAVAVTARSGEVLGALVFGHRDRGVFTERAERLIVGIAAQAAIAIDNARLYEEARRAADERARLLETERLGRIEIERVSLMKDEFLATLSHELRTPLNAVLGWSQILLTQSVEGSETRRGLETIVRNARSQAQLIDDLLDMNRIVSGKMSLDVQRLDLPSIVAAALDSVRPSADGKGIAIRRTIDPNAGPVFGDPNRLQQVVWNLLTNAVKFTPKGGKIDVIVQRVNSHVEVIVQDSGIGISTDFLPHVFERFRQADSTTTRRHGGLGLGLSIVKHLVELHGGTVEVESDGPGTGATFIVNLPVRAVRDTVTPPRGHPTRGESASPDPPEVSLAGIRVLVIDDELDARELVRTVLESAVAEVLTAASADEALLLVQSERPDVIVSDVGMPERDGYAFIRELRRLAPACGGKTPAIALTAFARSEDRTRAMLAGYQVHVSKPIEPQELVATVMSLVGHIGARES